MVFFEALFISVFVFILIIMYAYPLGGRRKGFFALFPLFHHAFSPRGGRRKEEKRQSPVVEGSTRQPQGGGKKNKGQRLPLSSAERPLPPHPPLTRHQRSFSSSCVWSWWWCGARDAFGVFLLHSPIFLAFSIAHQKRCAFLPSYRITEGKARRRVAVEDGERRRRMRTIRWRDTEGGRRREGRKPTTNHVGGNTTALSTRPHDSRVNRSITIYI